MIPPHPPRVPFYRHHLGEAEKASVCAALEQTFLTTGGLVERFEREFAGYLGVERAVGMSSWTDAARMVLLAWGIGPGDEVITTPLTFIASANVILHVGATPVFVDVEPDTFNMDAAAVERAITPRTKAILPVHLYGTMCDMRALRRIADRHGLKILEDAAHCVEGRRNGIGVGQSGDAACFSFYATKNLTSGEGGAVATNDAALAERLAILRLHGMDRSAANRYSGAYKHWDMSELGWKANLSNIDAALLLPQVPGIDARLARREEIARRYEAAIAGMDGLSVQRIPADCRPARHLFTVLCGTGVPRVRDRRDTGSTKLNLHDRRDAGPTTTRDTYLAAMQAAGIGVAVNYRAITQLTWYRENAQRWRAAMPLTHAESIGERTMTLPLYPVMRDEEVEAVVESLFAAHRGWTMRRGPNGTDIIPHVHPSSTRGRDPQFA